jgi:hypothetical protein
MFPQFNVYSGGYNMNRIKPIRAVAAGILGGLAASLVIFILFRLIGFEYWGILVDPQYQSPKLIMVWTELEPIPVAINHPEIMTLGFVALAVIHSFVFSVIKPGIPGEGWKKGLGFGAIVWLFSYLFFEFFTPWNMFGEPVTLVILELLFWIPVALSEGIVIAKVCDVDSM